MINLRFHCCESHAVCSSVGDDQGGGKKSAVGQCDIVDMHGHVFVTSIERMVAGRPELDKYYLANMIGQPLETSHTEAGKLGPPP